MLMLKDILGVSLYCSHNVLLRYHSFGLNNNTDKRIMRSCYLLSARVISNYQSKSNILGVCPDLKNLHLLLSSFRVTAVGPHSHLYRYGPFCITAFDKIRLYISSLKLLSYMFYNSSLVPMIAAFRIHKFTLKMIYFSFVIVYACM